MSKKRLLYLDNLKVCLTVLVIFHHAGQAYGDGGDWAYQGSQGVCAEETHPPGYSAFVDGWTDIYFIRQAGDWAHVVLLGSKRWVTQRESFRLQ